jgi:hypothetical protein
MDPDEAADAVRRAIDEALEEADVGLGRA